VSRLINKILVYSAIKISANGPDLNSVLNPETNSDSPSARSNGVRLVSARIETTQIISIGIIIKLIEGYEYILLRFTDLLRMIGYNRIRNNLTSYEIVWALPRRAPIKEYLEFLAHPERRVEYTLILEIHKNRRIECLNLKGLI
jgi:hypothetical protein